MTRRDFTRLGVLGLAAARSPLPHLRAASTSVSQHLNIHFRTAPERLAQALPPPFKPSPTGDLLIEYSLAVPASSERNVLQPGTQAVCALYAGVENEGTPSNLLLAKWTSSERLRINSREYLNENTRHAQIAISKDGAKLTASLRRHGVEIHRIDTTLTGENAEAPAGGAASHFVYRYRLHPDWTEGLLRDAEAGLWLVERGSALDGPDASALPWQVCDLTATGFKWPQASPLDPFIEFPVTALEQVAYRETTATGSAPAPEFEVHKTVFHSKVSREDFQPYCLWNYERPVSDGEPWRPAGWRGTASAFKLDPSEVAVYRARKEIRLGPFDLIDLRLAVTPEKLRPALPPALAISPRPALRIVALRVEASDVSPEPYSEVWLLAQCALEQRSGWYALSHIVTAGGDVTYGRETFGYPSKAGDVQAAVTPVDFTLQGRRLDREFLFAEGGLTGMSSGTSLSSLPVFGLRAGPFEGGGAAAGELVWQPWHYQGQIHHIRRDSVSIELPEKTSEAFEGYPDPWFEFMPFQVLSASAMIHGTMQRAPGRVVARVSDAVPYYLERCDGVLPGSEVGDAPPQPTFHPAQASLLQS